ncbi:MAG: hypothetical protein WKF89_01910 [Chitinophagaceae bacterium]
MITEETLVANVKKRDEKACHVLYNKYASSVYGIVCKYHKEEESRKAVFEKIFLKIFNTISTYDSSKSGLFMWMYSIVHTELRMEMKDRE